jgi:hypothetical protein
MAIDPHAEPQAPKVFQAHKPGKAKIDKGSLADGKEKRFCFHCYKPGHGKFECITKLLCDIWDEVRYHGYHADWTRGEGTGGVP